MRHTLVEPKSLASTFIYRFAAGLGQKGQGRTDQTYGLN